MTAICDAAIHLCRVRVTRLDQLGNVLPGPHNVYVTDRPIMLGVKPQIIQGEEKDLVGGCDCVIATYKGYDKLKRFDLEFDLGVLEPGLLEMLTGGAARLDGSGFPIGIDYPSNLSCSQPAQPNVCFEAWQDLWDVDHQPATPYPYVHYVYPSTHWQIGDSALENDFTKPKLNGFTRGNPQWGLGIFGDLTQVVGPMGSWEYASVIPAAACGYQSFAIT